MPSATAIRALNQPSWRGSCFVILVATTDNATSHERDQADRSTDNRGTFDSLAVGDFVERESDLTTSDQAFPIDANSTSNAALTARFVEHIETDLSEGAEDASAEGIAVNGDAILSCVELAKAAAPHVTRAPRLKSAAFIEDDGTVSLVLQSFATDRRLNFRIGKSDLRITAFRINEEMISSAVAVSGPDSHAVRELVEWVVNRA